MSNKHRSLNIDAKKSDECEWHAEFDEINQEILSRHEPRQQKKIIQIDKSNREDKLNDHHFQTCFPIKPVAFALKYSQLV
jgi:hypothetical protein